MWALRWSKDLREMRPELSLEEWTEFKICKREFKIQERGDQWKKKCGKHTTKNDRVLELFLWVIWQLLFFLFSPLISALLLD